MSAAALPGAGVNDAASADVVASVVRGLPPRTSTRSIVDKVLLANAKPPMDLLVLIVHRRRRRNANGKKTSTTTQYGLDPVAVAQFFV